MTPTLTTAQLQSLKTLVLADAAATALWNSGDNTGVQNWLNTNASPDFWVYRTNISSGEIGKTVSYVAIAAMTTANLDRVNNFLNLNPMIFSGRDDIKTFLSDTFSGALGGQGQATRDALDLMLRRKTTRAEKTFALGTGSPTNPGSLVAEGDVTLDEVRAMRTI